MLTKARLVSRPALLSLALVAFAFAGCGVAGALPDADGLPSAAPVAIELRWQRLVDAAGKTCGRCGATEESLAEAESQLRTALEPLGLRLQVRKQAITPAAFAAAPAESNRIYIDGRSIEDLLGATTGKSACCDACGDQDCRTLIVDGRTHEAISARLIVRATLIAAAARLAAPDGGGSPAVTPCCAPGSETGTAGAAPCCDSRPGAGVPAGARGSH